MRSRGLFCLYEERRGREGNGRAKRGKKPSGEWFFSSPGWRRHWPSAAGRVPLSPPNKKAQSFWAFCLFLSLLCPQNPAKRFHTKFLTGFHFEFHSLKEETLFIATPQSHFVRQLPGRGAFWVQCKHGVQCRTPRGAIVSMGLRGRQGA